MNSYCPGSFEIVFRDALTKNDRCKMDRNALVEMRKREAGEAAETGTE